MGKLFCIAVLIGIGFSCSSKKVAESAAEDSTKAISDSISSANSVTTPSAIANVSVVNLGLGGADSLFNILAREKAVHGIFDSLTVITRDFLDVSNPGKTGLLAVLFRSREDNDQTGRQVRYYKLAVFHEQGGTWGIEALGEEWENENYGIQFMSTSAEPINLAPKQQGAMVHFKSAEEGAGDSGYNRDTAGIFVLQNGQLTRLLEVMLLDFSFVSNETDTYVEHTSTGSIAMQDEVTKGLYNVSITYALAQRDVEPEGESAEQASTEVAQDDTSPSTNTGEGTYKWNGSAYEKQP